MSNNGNLTVTKAGSWRRQGELVTLPSGNTAMLVVPNLLDVITVDGKVPDALANLMQQGKKSEEEADLDMTPENMQMLLPMIQNICKASFLQPRIVDEPDPNKEEITIADVDFLDQVEVMKWAFGRFKPPTQTFSAESVRGMVAASRGEGVQRKTKRNSGS